MIEKTAIPSTMKRMIGYFNAWRRVADEAGPTSPLLVALVFTSMLLLGGSAAPFPSTDDSAYVPLSLHLLDSTLFVRDYFVSSTQSFHLVYALIVAFGEYLIGLPLAFYLALILQFVVCLWAFGRLLESLKVHPVLVFVVSIFSILGSVAAQGVGRSEFGGLTPTFFHSGNMSLVVALFSVSSVLRYRYREAGLIMALAVVVHPVSALHVVVSLVPAIVYASGCKLKSLLNFVVPIAVAGCALAIHLFLSDTIRPPEATAEIIRSTYIFRTFHEFGELSWDARGLPLHCWHLLLSSMAWLLICYVGSTANAVRFIANSLFLFMVSLSFWELAYLVLHEWQLCPQITNSSYIPYLLHLSRSSPLIRGVGAILITKGLVVAFTESAGRAPIVKIGLWSFILAAFLLLDQYVGAFGVSASLGGAIIAFCVLTVVLSRKLKVGELSLAQSPWYCLLFSGVLIVVAAMLYPLEDEVGYQDQALYDWVKHETPKESLFIIPPKLEGFRLHTRRSVYVDFKFPAPSKPQLFIAWRQRLETLCDPGPLMSQVARGWISLDYWQRAYATINDGPRILRLLENTGADYWLFDQRAAAIPPVLEPKASPSDDGLIVAYRNERYLVFSRKGN